VNARWFTAPAVACASPSAARVDPAFMAEVLKELEARAARTALEEGLAKTRVQVAEARRRIAATTRPAGAAAADWSRVDAITASRGRLYAGHRRALQNALPLAERELEAALEQAAAARRAAGPLAPADQATLDERLRAAGDRVAAITARLARAPGWAQVDAITAAHGPLSAPDRKALKDALPLAERELEAALDRAAAIRARAAGTAARRPRAGQAGWARVDAITASAGPLTPADRATLEKGLLAAEAAAGTARARVDAITARLVPWSNRAGPAPRAV
jgi:hypothetical protein